VDFYAKQTNMSQNQEVNSMYEPPSVSHRPRVYHRLFDRACVDMFYDVVEKIREVVFADMPRYEDRLLYPNAIVDHPMTVLYPQSTAEIDQSVYSYTINFNILFRAVDHAGVLSVFLYPANRQVHIQKRFGDERVYSLEINVPRLSNQYSNSNTDGEGTSELAITDLYPHLRLGFLEKLRLWLLLPPWHHIHQFFNHAPAYQDLLRRIENLNTSQAQERLNLEQFLTAMMQRRSNNLLRSGGAEDIARMIYRMILDEQTQERRGLYPGYLGNGSSL